MLIPFSRCIHLVFMLGLANTHATAQENFSVMSFNIRFATESDGLNAWSQRKAEVGELVDHYQPDFLGLQEALHPQLEDLLSALPSHDYIGVGRDDGKQAGEYSAILFNKDRFEVLSSGTFWLSPKPDTPSIAWGANIKRVCTYGVFLRKHNPNTSSKPDTLYVFNTHFDHQSSLARLESAKLIAQRIAQLETNASVILMGDLNTEPDSDPIKILEELFSNAGKSGETKKIYGPPGTWNGFDPTTTPDRRIDYIFARGAKLISYRHVDDRRDNGLWPSDHLPVLAVFE